MILNNTQENTPILSNVNEIGEFRIRNSAKAFSILSSGLYANKIRAIIRELSCNACDSHVAAGCADRAFEVHLPNRLEPWFSIRDYGVGLSHDQVINIYTTYFESTKTDSNAFIGALGLGSKSPFSYTENFTVTAIQNGRQGIYTAFINEQGVPSIALMSEASTDQPNGVEVKFSVADQSDYIRFHSEAESVYRWFTIKPTVTGGQINIQKPKYQHENLIPGVHQLSIHSSKSYAVMGNIAYPIQMPNIKQNLGALSELLECGLVMEFTIGELDFQASREGLSYIPITIDAIRQKLVALDEQLGEILAKDVESVDNFWLRILRLRELSNTLLFRTAAQGYITANKLNNATNDYAFTIPVKQIEQDFNLVIHSFTTMWRRKGAVTVIPTRDYYNGTGDFWKIQISKSVNFVIDDLKRGTLTRAKTSLRNTSNQTVYVLAPHDTTRPADSEGFLKLIQNPPTQQVQLASQLPAVERKSRERRIQNATIMRLERKTDHRYRSGWDQWVWRSADSLSNFSTTVTFYYVPLNGYDMISQRGIKLSAKDLRDHAENSGIWEFNGLKLYGVRKADLPQVEKLSNWKNLEDFLVEKLTQADPNVILRMSRNQLTGLDDFLRKMGPEINDQSPVWNLKKKYEKVSNSITCSSHSLHVLCESFGVKGIVDSLNQVKLEAQAVMDRYPLIKEISSNSFSTRAAIAQYVNLVDQHQETK